MGFSYVEIFSIIVVLLSCFFIYFKTKEIYDLTSHKGIGYFRKAFLFFGFSAVILSLFSFIGSVGFEFRFFFRFIILFQLIGILYFLFSLFYKKLKYEWIIYLFTLFVLLSSFMFRSKYVLGFLVFFIFSVVGVVSIYNYLYKKKSSKINSNIYFIYSLLFVFWGLRFLLFIFDLTLYFEREFYHIMMAVVFMYIGFIVNDKLTLRKK